MYWPLLEVSLGHRWVLKTINTFVCQQHHHTWAERSQLIWKLVIWPLNVCCHDSELNKLDGRLKTGRADISRVAPAATWVGHIFEVSEQEIWKGYALCPEYVGMWLTQWVTWACGCLSPESNCHSKILETFQRTRWIFCHQRTTVTCLCLETKIVFKQTDQSRVPEGRPHYRNSCKILRTNDDTRCVETKSCKHGRA
jgi:hypothetical protein